MSIENKNGEENRRGFFTWVDPRTLPTLIPMILAIASAFTMHDRAINTIETQIINITSVEERHINQIDGILDEISEVKSRISELTANINNMEQLSKNTTSKQLEQFKSELLELRQRLRELEREVDRKLE